MIEEHDDRPKLKDLYGTQGYIQAEINFNPSFTDKTDTESDVAITLTLVLRPRTISTSLMTLAGLK